MGGGRGERRGRKGLAESRCWRSLEENSPGGLGESEDRKDRSREAQWGQLVSPGWTHLYDIALLRLSHLHSPQALIFLALRSHSSPIFLLLLVPLQQRTLLCNSHHWSSPHCSSLSWTLHLLNQPPNCQALHTPYTSLWKVHCARWVILRFKF